MRVVFERTQNKVSRKKHQQGNRREEPEIGQAEPSPGNGRLTQRRPDRNDHDRGQFAPWTFESLRYRADGSENPAFILNQAPFRDAKILLSGANSGCGSSREMAVWAIEEFGIRCIVASSYGDIFFNNCLQNGLLPVTLPTEQIALLAEPATRGDQLHVDLECCTIGTTQQCFHFDFPEEQRQALLQGLDDIDRSRLLEPRITTFQQADQAARP